MVAAPAEYTFQTYFICTRGMKFCSPKKSVIQYIIDYTAPWGDTWSIELHFSLLHKNIRIFVHITGIFYLAFIWMITFICNTKNN